MIISDKAWGKFISRLGKVEGAAKDKILAYLETGP